MKLLLATEVYPPRAGGAGWSTRALALGLREAGHSVTIVTTSVGPTDLDGLTIERLKVLKHRRFSVPRAIAARLHELEWDVGHAQHSLSALGCLNGDRAGRVAVTIRDHWPVCFWSTRISRGSVCPECGLLPMTRCVTGHVPAQAPLSFGAIPYMKLDLGQKRRALERSGANLAVSEAVAKELRATGIPRVEVIPNIVDAEEARLASLEGTLPLPDRYLLFVGKLEENKGARLLIPAIARAGTGLPLVVLGEGTLQHELHLAAARHGVELVMRGWASREDVLMAMSQATALVFPSLWPEPLSRVLLEGIAVGTPIAAMRTGGTPEILTHEEDGLLCADTDELGDAVARLADDDRLRHRLADGARQRARAFAPDVLVPRYEAVYKRLL